MKKTRVIVHFTVDLNERQLKALKFLAEETGNTHSDAGPVLSMQRTLMDIGINGCFEGDLQHGLEFRLNIKPVDFGGA